MKLRVTACLLVAFTLAACLDLPPLDTATISSSPARSSDMAAARMAVNICKGFPDSRAVISEFRAKGFRSGAARMVLNDGTELQGSSSINSDDGRLLVQVTETHCYIGLRGMTPQQSFELARIWARHFDAKTNAELGQGLSEHVVQAWRTRVDGRMMFFAAHKTWPWDRGRWPDVPGAAVTLSY